MKKVMVILGLGVIAFAITLGIYIGNHLSPEALSVLTGAVCGVGAVLPAALVAGLALLRRRDRDDMGRMPAGPPPVYPPVIVVSPPAVSPPQSPGSPYGPVLPAALPRQFTVIGDDPFDSPTQK